MNIDNHTVLQKLVASKPAITILFHLYEVGSELTHKLIRETASQSGFYRSFRFLQELGLAERQLVAGTKAQGVRYFLTEKGKQTVVKLKELKTLLEKQ